MFLVQGLEGLKIERIGKEKGRERELVPRTHWDKHVGE